MVMFDMPVVFIDIETTGAGYRTSRVLEVAAIRYENGEITDTYTTLINPGTRVPYFITQITGITTADIQDAPPFSAIADRLAEILEGAVFIAHNVNFDYSFIKNEFAMLGRAFSMNRLCTVRLSRALYPHHSGHSLEKIINRHDIPFESRHRAYDDARALIYFAELAHAEHGSGTFTEAVGRQLKTQNVPAKLKPEDIQVVENTPGVYIFKDEDDVVLYVGKSVTMRDRIKSHFQDKSIKEVRLADKTAKVDFIETGDEMLALLLESRLVKKLSPVFNRQLRRVTKYCMLVQQIDDVGYAHADYIDGLPGAGDEMGNIYGIYETRAKAKKWADIYALTFDLCPKLMGLENGSGPCFRYSLGKCRGACAGVESPASYNARFEIALSKSKLDAWPYDGEVTMPIGATGTTMSIHNWVVTDVGIPSLQQYFTADTAFDLDEYKILNRHLGKSTRLTAQ